MSTTRKIYLKNSLDLNENIEVIFAYFHFRSEVTVSQKGEYWETTHLHKPEYYNVALQLCFEGRYLPIPPVGFEPSIRIIFSIRHYSEEEIDEFIRDTLSLVQDKDWDMFLVWGDADLLFGYEQGSLYLNSNFDLERMQGYANQLNIPYTVKAIPSF